jgi:hypothetical protein
MDGDSVLAMFVQNDHQIYRMLKHRLISGIKWMETVYWVFGVVLRKTGIGGDGKGMTQIATFAQWIPGFRKAMEQHGGGMARLSTYSHALLASSAASTSSESSASSESSQASSQAFTEEGVLNHDGNATSFEEVGSAGMG